MSEVMLFLIYLNAGTLHFDEQARYSTHQACEAAATESKPNRIQLCFNEAELKRIKVFSKHIEIRRKT